MRYGNLVGWGSVVLAVAALAAPAALAAEGKVEFATGDVSVIAGGKASKAVLGAPVAPGQAVRTGGGGVAIVELADGTKLKLNEKSEISMPKNQANEVDLKAGGVFAEVAKQKPGTRFQIRTRSATMGVRGTRFFTSFGKERKDGQDVWMCVDEGSVEVVSLANKGHVLVRKGEGVLLPAGKEITPPKAYDWTRNLNWNMDPAKGDVVDKTRIDYSKEALTQDYD